MSPARPRCLAALAAAALLTALARPAAAAPGAEWADPGPRCKLVEGEALRDPADPMANWRARTEPRRGTFAAAVDGCPHDYDVLHYEINFNSVDPAVPNLDGNTVIDLESTVDGLTSIDLNLTSQMTVSSVTVTPNGSTGFSHAADVLSVDLASAADTGDPLTVDVAYSGPPANEGAGGFGGFWWSAFPKVAFSMGVGLNSTPPSMGYTWFPCYDWPCDKATVDLNVETPLSQVVVANGLLAGVDSTATDHTWHWSHDFPITTYLIAMAVAPYRTLSASIVTDPRITVYFHPGYRTDSEVSFRNVDLMMQGFETRYGAYPFDKFAYMTTSIGDMEHQTCVSHAISLVDSTNAHDDILAHEMAHMWFGDCVTYADWHNIWLSEGFATFSEAVFFEEQGGMGAYHAHMTQIMNAVINSGNTDGVYDPPDNWGVVNYEKGGSLLHMLRGVLDDDPLFWQLLRDFHAAHAYGNATTADFTASASASAGQDLTWFFDPWLYGEGHPHYEYGWSATDLGGGQWRVDAVVRQVQTTANLFDMPVDFRVQTAGGDFDFSERIDQAVEEVSFVVTAQPTGLLVDPDNWILDEQSLAPTSADFDAAAAAAQALQLDVPRPNPARDLTQIRYYLPRAAEVDVTVHDVAGRRIRTLGSGAQIAGSRALWWDRRADDGARVGAGVYWVRLSVAGEAPLARKVVVRD